MELTLNSDDQDRIMYLCILDSKFLAQAIRKRIEPKHFASDVRQKVYRTAIEFHGKYKKAPGDNILVEIDEKVRRKKIKEEDKAIIDEYLINVFSIPEFSKDYIKDKVDFFIKTRIIKNVTNTLLKMQDRVDIDPDTAIDVLREAVIEADSSIGRKGAESILYDPLDSIQKRDFVTRFGIDIIDSQLKGGLKPKNYVVIQAFLGAGKSWCINHLAKMAVRFGHSPLVIPTEMSNETARLRFRMSFSGMKIEDVLDKPAKVRGHITSSMNKGADIFLLSEEEKGMKVDELPAVIEEVETRTGKIINPILFDSADDLEPPFGKFANKLEANTAIHTYLKNYAKNENKCVVTTTQAQRAGETKVWLGAASVGDNINKFRKATVGISINALEDEKKKWIYRLWLFKNTDGSEGAKVWVKRNYEIGQFIMKYGRFVNQESYNDMMEKFPIMEKGNKPQR